MVILYWLNENVMLHIIPFYPMSKRGILRLTLKNIMHEQEFTAFIDFPCKHLKEAFKIKNYL